jgi:ABC-type transporter Mla MlaB component
MPGESIQYSAADQIAGSALTFAVEQQDRLIWITLSGILDREGLHRLARRAGASLAAPGCRVVLDGRRLAHVDYRVVERLADWRRRLARQGQQLELIGWSDYLRAILAVADWRGELAPARTYWSSWRVISGAQRTRLP